MKKQTTGSNFGIIWDMDGVLTDSADSHYLSWKETLFSDYKIDFSRKDFEDTFGINDYSLVKKFVHPTPPDADIWETALKKELLYREEIREKLIIYPGAVEILKACQSFGFKQALDSSAPQENIDIVLEVGNLKPYFDQVISTDKLPAKNFPDAYLAASTALKLDPKNCLVVEDSILGIEGVKKAGMQCIAIASTHPKERLQRADLIVPAIDQLNIEIIQKLLGLK